MKIPKSCLPLAALLALVLLFSLPAFSASREIIQLQTQVQQLQDQMTQMRQSFDERMGIMKNLIEQTTDNMNKVNANLTALQKTLQQTHDDAGARTDQISGQIQSLNDSVDELKTRVAKLSKQLDDMQNAGQNIPSGATPPGAAAQQAPPADVLYNNALRDYNAAKYDLAAQEFAQYVQVYPTTDLAGNSQFYLADIEYKQGNFQQAVKDFDKVLEQYPGGTKAPSAQLRKGFALLELKQTPAGTRELYSLIQRYPRSPEAVQARERLKKMGISTAPRRPGM